jgi:hypothetical protein
LKHIVKKAERGWLLAKKCGYQRLHPVIKSDRSRVFVAGMQRSGTNMLMDVLEESLETDVYHERDPRAFDNYRMRGRVEIKGLMDSSSARVFIIKALCELQDLTDLMEVFAPAKTVWIVRHYDDVVNSMLRSFGNMAKQVQRITRDRDSSGWLGLGMSDSTHETLKNTVTESLDDTSASALQWYFRNMLFFDQLFDSDDRVLLVGYEQLVSHPVDEFERIYKFIGLEFSPRVVRKVTPRSIGKLPSPDIAPPVRDLCDELLHRFHALTGDGH